MIRKFYYKIFLSERSAAERAKNFVKNFIVISIIFHLRANGKLIAKINKLSLASK